jgi:septum site-determining protein MinC
VADNGARSHQQGSQKSWLSAAAEIEREVGMTSVGRAQRSSRAVYRSYLAFVLVPEPPVADWLAVIHDEANRAQNFFVGRPVVLDLSLVTLSTAAVGHLISELDRIGIRVMGIENLSSEQVDSSLPPLLNSRGNAAVVPAPPEEEQGRAAGTLLIEEPIRSGQSVFHPDGDVTVLGSVGSGAELVAGGSIHIYGTLRGRVMAGANGNSKARVFCRRIEAELLAINGFYCTADLIDPAFASRPIQAWLDGSRVKIETLD